MFTLSEVAADDTVDVVGEVLYAQGGPELRESKRELYRTAAQSLLHDANAAGVSAESRLELAWVPGRIEVLGKHTDYAGGNVLVGAVNRGFAVVCTVPDVDQPPRCGDAVVVHRVSPAGDTEPAEIAHLTISHDAELPPVGHWSRLVAVALRRYAKNFPAETKEPKVHHVAACSDLPPSSGMSTSSAVICWTWMLFGSKMCQAAHNLQANRLLLSNSAALVEYLGCVENGKTFTYHDSHQQSVLNLQGTGGIGTFGGSEDHAAIMTSKPGCLHHWSFYPRAQMITQPYPHGLQIPTNWTFAIAYSGVRANKSDGQQTMKKFNDSAAQASKVASLLDSQSIAHALHKLNHNLQLKPDASPEQQQKLLTDGVERTNEVLTKQMQQSAETLPQEKHQLNHLQTRLQQFLYESESHVPALCYALSSLSPPSLLTEHDQVKQIVANVIDDSHRRTVHELQNTVPETEALAVLAKKSGAVCASAFGAGYGGSTYALLQAPTADELKTRSEDFLKKWREEYLQVYPQYQKTAVFFVTRPACGAFLFDRTKS